MKEKIYTIPINEAFDEACSCPLCFIEHRLGQEAVEYQLGPAMMEPNHREITNEKGFCSKHWEMLYEIPQKLPLALVMDTHLEQMRKKLEKMTTVKTKGILKKASGKESIEKEINSCAVCDKVNKTMDRYCGVLIKMWKDDKEFRDKFNASQGFCLKHFEKLYSMSDDKEFLEAIAAKESAELEKLQSDIHKFTLMFDYRNKDTEWGTAKNAPARCLERLAGVMKES